MSAKTSTPKHTNLEWRQRRIRYGIILWLMRLGPYTYADVTNKHRRRVIDMLGYAHVMHIQDLVNDFDRLVDVGMANSLNNLRDGNPLDQQSEYATKSMRELKHLMLKYSANV